jgi:hypothetical protein
VRTIKRLARAAQRQSLDDGLRDETDAVVAHIYGHGVSQFARVGKQRSATRHDTCQKGIPG